MTTLAIILVAAGPPVLCLYLWLRRWALRGPVTADTVVLGVLCALLWPITLTYLAATRGRGGSNGDI